MPSSFALAGYGDIAGRRTMTGITLPELHDVVLDALDFFAATPMPPFRLPPARRRLVVASGNALPTGRILFADEPAVFASEGQYAATLARERDIDAAVVISASGTKHAPRIIQDLAARGVPPSLVTCEPASPAAAQLPAERVVATRSRPEPITYNTSTYMGMILAKTREDPQRIRRHIVERVQPLLPDLAAYGAFYLMVPPTFEAMAPMFVTKFDELFGGRIAGRCYTTEQTMHAKTVVPWERELFVGLGCENRHFGSARLAVPLPDDAGFAAMMAVGYYVIGRMQHAMPPWFLEHAIAYAGLQKRLFAERDEG
jgi:hypothetical protein